MKKYLTALLFLSACGGQIEQDDLETSKRYQCPEGAICFEELEQFSDFLLPPGGITGVVGALKYGCVGNIPVSNDHQYDPYTIGTVRFDPNATALCGSLCARDAFAVQQPGAGFGDTCAHPTLDWLSYGLDNTPADPVPLPAGHEPQGGSYNPWDLTSCTVGAVPIPTGSGGACNNFGGWFCPGATYSYRRDAADNSTAGIAEAEEGYEGPGYFWFDVDDTLNSSKTLQAVTSQSSGVNSFDDPVTGANLVTSTVVFRPNVYQANGIISYTQMGQDAWDAAQLVADGGFDFDPNGGPYVNTWLSCWSVVEPFDQIIFTERPN